MLLSIQQFHTGDRAPGYCHVEGSRARSASLLNLLGNNFQALDFYQARKVWEIDPANQWFTNEWGDPVYNWGGRYTLVF